MQETFELADFDYQLPQELIAQSPLQDRAQSRLLHVGEERLEHGVFTDIVEHVSSGDLLVINDTRVLKARLLATKDSGGRAEVLLERIVAEREAVCQVRVSKPLKAGRMLWVDGKRVSCLERAGEFYRLGFPSPVVAFLDQHGHVPLPPYIERGDEQEDEERYQTVYGRVPGAVAAPTAGLHFTQKLLDVLEDRGVGIANVTLHVGAGTFQPVRQANLAKHEMHKEWYEVPPATAAKINAARDRGGKVIAVGTTVVRTLESAVRSGCGLAGSGETDLFIKPGFRFQVVDKLVTNFHLPRSTLLMLVCAFGGYDRTMRAYSAAIEQGYRFFSYGDAMMLERDHV